MLRKSIIRCIPQDYKCACRTSASSLFLLLAKPAKFLGFYAERCWRLLMFDSHLTRESNNKQTFQTLHPQRMKIFVNDNNGNVSAGKRQKFLGKKRNIDHASIFHICWCHIWHKIIMKNKPAVCNSIFPRLYTCISPGAFCEIILFNFGNYEGWRH